MIPGIVMTGRLRWTCSDSGVQLRHYFYNVHVSRKFLVMPTLAASLYMLLLRFLDRQYGAVFRMADSIVRCALGFF
eukprot:4728417-Pyramimonas_sp.AAC.1